MAVPWLDAARYADTHGYHIDSHRGMWPWRDWVIGAFNRNLPFDQFTIEQLAGDLLPNATREQKVASGFNRNHMINFEGGAIADEYQVEYVMDRVEATSTAFMGLTMGCARCHSHKFDPISHKEFYQFFAFFNNVPELGLDGRRGNAAPMLLLTSPAQQKMLDDLDASIKAHEAALDDDIVGPVQREWEKTVAGKTRFPESDGVDRAGLTAHYELDGSFSDISGRYQHGRMVTGDPTFDVGQIGRAATFDGDTEVSFGNVGGFDRAEAFSLAVWLRGRGNQPIAVFQKLDNAQHRRGYEWKLDDFELFDIQRWAARLTITMTSDSPKNAIQVRTRERLKQGEWNHVVMLYDGSGKADGLAVYANGERLAVDVLQNALAGPVSTNAELTVGRSALGLPFIGQIDDLRLYNRVLTRGEVEDLAINYRPRAILSGVNGKRSKDQDAYLREYFLTYAAPDALRGPHTELERAAEAERSGAEADSDGDGDGGAEEASRKLRARARGLSQPDREGPARRARDAAADRACGRGWRADQSAHAGEVARATRASAHVARRGESLLADVLRTRHRQDAGRLRRAGRAAGPSGAPRLAGHRVRADGLGHPGHAAAHRDIS